MSTKITYDDLFLLFLKNCNFDSNDDVAFDWAVKEHLQYASLGALNATMFLQFKDIADSFGTTVDYDAYLKITETIRTRLWYYRQKQIPVEVKLSEFPVGNPEMSTNFIEATIVHVVKSRALNDELIELRESAGTVTYFYRYLGQT